MKKLVVMASGKGSNFATILNAIKCGQVNGEVVALIVDKDCGAMDIAKQNKIPIFLLKNRDFTKELLQILQSLQPDFIVLAGFMRILKAMVVKQYHNKIVNIHPSILPAFTGLNAVEQALEYGVKITGCTVHFVDEKLDHGPIIHQAVVSVSNQDSPQTLLKKIQKKEHKLYPQAIKWLCNDQVIIKGRTVYIKEDNNES